MRTATNEDRDAAVNPTERLAVSDCATSIITAYSQAAALMNMGRYVEALPPLRFAVDASAINMDITMALTKNDPSLVIVFKHTLAQCLLQMGKLGEALPLLERLVKESTRGLGLQHPCTLQISRSRAGCLAQMDRLDEARAVFEDVITLQMRVLGSHDPSTLQSMIDLGCCLMDKNLADEALPMLRMVADTCRQTLGVDHHQTLSSETSVACCLARLKSGTVAAKTESLSLFQHVLEVRRRTLGEDHPETLRCMNAVAGCLHRGLGRTTEALPLARTAVACFERTLGSEHPDTLEATSTLASCLDALGSTSEALPLLRNTADRSRRTLGSQHSSTKRYSNVLAEVLADTRAAVMARRQALAQGRSPADAALAATGLQATRPPLTVGSPELVNERAPTVTSRSSRQPNTGRSQGSARQQRGGGGRRGGRRHHHEGPRVLPVVSTAATETAPQVEMDQRSAAEPLVPPAAAVLDEGLAPLPPGFQAGPWSAVRDSSLGGEDCAICLENMMAADGSDSSLVVQFRCKHTFCEICVREFLQTAARRGHRRGGKGGDVVVCPRCRADIF